MMRFLLIAMLVAAALSAETPTEDFVEALPERPSPEQFQELESIAVTARHAARLARSTSKDELGQPLEQVEFDKVNKVNKVKQFDKDFFNLPHKKKKANKLTHKKKAKRKANKMTHKKKAKKAPTKMPKSKSNFALTSTKRGYRPIYRHGLFRENVYYFRQGCRVPNLTNRRPNMARWRQSIYYRNTGGRWHGFARSNHFAVRWTGRVRFYRSGHYRFSIISDDGSKLWINNRYTINNDGCHGWRNREATRYMRAGWSMFRLEYFERTGHAGMLLRYRGPDTGNRWRVLRARGTRNRI